MNAALLLSVLPLLASIGGDGAAAPLTSIPAPATRPRR